MVKINVDPHEKGYKLQPTYRLSAAFENCDELMDVVQSLERAGFAEDQIDVFCGDEGAYQLDYPAKHHGIIARMKRAFEVIYADETDMLKKIDMTLRRGGMAVFVFIGNDEQKKNRALEVLKPFNPSEMCYFGNLAVERLWVRQSPVPVPAHSTSPP